MPSNYNCLLLDLDGTLFDFKAAEQEAISGTLAQFSLPNGDDTTELFAQINTDLWAKLERGEVRKEHLTVQRFSRLLESLNAKGDAIRMNNDFMTRLSQAAPIIPGANEVLEELAEFVTLAAVSNGIHRVQIARLEKSGLLPYFDDIFVSEKMGATKPSAKIFEGALKKLGIRNRNRVLVVGDSLTADVQGGKNAGLDTCWCNFADTENATGLKPTYTIRSLAELKLVAVGEEELKNAANREKRHIL